MQQALSRHELTVVTPEQIRLRFQTAGVGSRAGAHAIDLGMLGLLLIVFLAVIGEVNYRSSGWVIADFTDYMIAGIIIAAAAVQLAYFVICECAMGRTLGGKIVGLRVIRENGQPVTVLSSIIRNLLRIIDFLPSFYLAGMVISFLHPKGKRLGDLLAGTVVIYEERPLREKKMRALPAMGWHGAGSAGFQLEEHHKRLVTREEWLMLSSMVERQDELTPEKTTLLGRKMARYFLNKLQLPPDIAGRVTQMTFLNSLYEQLKGEWEL